MTMKNAEMEDRESMRLAQERKFVAHAEKAEYALSVMEHMCAPDPEHPVGRIRSIYYDTLQLTAYAEKADGDNLKQKLRLRWYQEDAKAANEHVNAFLEIKYRFGGARHKVRAEASAPGAWLDETPLADESMTRFLYEHAEGFHDRIPLGLVPVVCIAYDRHRFVCPLTGGGVAVDRNILVERVNEDLFPPSRPMAIETTVVEFKQPGLKEMPWAGRLYRAGFRLRSFSKYGESIHRMQYGGLTS